MKVRLMKNWIRKWRRWFAGALVTTSCAAGLVGAQEREVPFFPVPPPLLGVEEKKPASIPEGLRTLPETSSPRQETNPPVEEKKSSASEKSVFGAWELPAVQAAYQPDADSGVVNALGKGKDKEGGIKQASCCGNGLFGGHGGGACGPGGCGASNKCVPGRLNCCSWCDHDSHLGRLFCGFYECLCCPDPCYEPHWVAAANAAFWVDGARPVTTTRIRWDSATNYILPDRAEFFWARSGGGGQGPKNIETNLRYNELNLYTEVAAKNASIFFDIPYRSMDPQRNPHTAGFSDMSVGAKSLFFDCELLQIAFQFKTILPAGSPGKGLGTGHVSLEPSLLCALKLAPDTYMQGQIAEWIPLGGDPTYAGAVLHYHASLNHVLYRCLPDVPLIGTVEFNGYSFQDGAFSDPTFGQFQNAGGNAFLSAGGGLRLVICNKVDIGFSAMYSVNQPGPIQFYRTEFRMRF